MPDAPVVKETAKVAEPPKRHDPPTRPVDGDINDAAVWVNQDPNRVYCEANPNDEDTGVNEMLRLGWTVELARKDGPRAIGGAVAADGSQLTRKGQVLLSRDRTLHEQYLRQTWAVADQRSGAISSRGGPGTDFRGPTGRPAEFKGDPRETLSRG